MMWIVQLKWNQVPARTQAPAQIRARTRASMMKRRLKMMVKSIPPPLKHSSVKNAMQSIQIKSRCGSTLELYVLQWLQIYYFDSLTK